jgi:endonuclease YncB( thermonuclease family)
MAGSASCFLCSFSPSVAAEPIAPGAIEVIDGDTIRAHGVVFRLVGLNAPETGPRARCEAERAKGAEASRRLRQLVAGGGLDLT